MKLSKLECVIARQANLGYLIPVGNGSYRIDKEELMCEMERRRNETELGTVSYNVYRKKLVELGGKLVN